MILVVILMQSILLVIITAAAVIATPNIVTVKENAEIATVSHLSHLSSSSHSSSSSSSRRALYRLDIFLYESDECENAPNQFGPCDTSRFPDCLAMAQQQQAQTELYPCYNRKPHRSQFWPDHNPKYYIRYDRIMCLPPDTVCSSCTPGRLCEAERRCILDEIPYNCSHWF